MMRKTLYIFLLSLFLFNCSDDSENISNNDNKTFTINGYDFSNFKVKASAIDHEYLISLTNENEALLIGTTDTIAGNYDLLEAKLDENDSLVFSDNLLPNSKLSIVSYITNNKSYLSTDQGNISITKDNQYNVSAKFDMTLYNVINSKDSIVIKNGFFDFIEPIVITTTPPNEPIIPEITKDDIQNILQASYTTVKEFAQLQFLIDAFYTQQITDRRLDDYNKHSVSPDDNTLKQFWNSIFRSIHFSNDVIENADKAYNNDSELKAVIAEAKTLRAYAYFNLLNWFENAPIILKRAESISETVSEFSNSTEIESQIISDLTFSTQNLQTSSNAQNVNLNFANTLLAKVYFKQKKYQETINLLDELTIDTSNANVFHLTVAHNELIPFYNLFIKETNLDICKNSEIWLMLASSYNNLNSISKALEYINKLKVTENNLSKKQISEELYNLWLLESNINGNRFYVLKVLDKAKETLNIENYQLILPIPQNEIDANIDIKQNPGY